MVGQEVFANNGDCGPSRAPDYAYNNELSGTGNATRRAGTLVIGRNRLRYLFHSMFEPMSRAKAADDGENRDIQPRKL